MGDFVGQNGCQFALTFRQTDRPGVDDDVSPRKRLRVNLWIVDNIKVKTC